MLTSHVLFYSEKLELTKYYSGELCDAMVFYETWRSLLVYSYFFAILLKLYNNYFQTILEIHIEAKSKDIKVSDVIKHRYFKFYIVMILESETQYSFFNSNHPLWAKMLTCNYIFILFNTLFIGTQNSDHQLVNMAIICFLDVLIEFFNIVPSWRRRQMLVLDLLIRILYD